MITLLVRIFLIALATLAVTHVLLLRFFLYWRHEWLDIPMHLFGGAIVALGVFAARDLNLPVFAHFKRLPAVLSVVFVIAISWEVFEFTSGVSVLEERFWQDTVVDLVVGLGGGVIGFIVGNSLSRMDV